MQKPELIDRAALKKHIGCANAVKYGNKDAAQAHISFSTLRMYEIADYIDDAPTIDAVPVVHGRWILGVPVTCSVCGKPAAEHDSPIVFWESPYCPWCGAKMDGKEG